MITHNTLNSYGFLGQKTLVVQQQDVPIDRRVLLPIQADLYKIVGNSGIRIVLVLHTTQELDTSWFDQELESS